MGPAPTNKFAPAQKVLVIGAGARVGKEVVARLKQENPSIFIRATCRRPEIAEFVKKLGADEVVAFDYSDEATFAPALKDMDRIFSMSVPGCVEGHKKFMELIGKEYKQQVKHIVRLGSLGFNIVKLAGLGGKGFEDTSECVHPSPSEAMTGQPYPEPMLGAGSEVDACLATGVPVTTVRGNFFMSTLLKNDVEKIQKEGYFSLPLGRARMAYTSTNDLGEIAALALLEGPEKHGRKFYDICGPEIYSCYEVAADLSQAIGKTVVYHPISQMDFMKQHGTDAWGVYEMIVCGYYLRPTSDFYNLTGRHPTGYLDHLTKPGAAGETGLEELFGSKADEKPW